MLRITGNAMKSEIAAAIQKYNGALIYSYGDYLPPFTECYHVDKCDGAIEEFCDFVLQDLQEKTKDHPLPMAVIYTNESDTENIKILEDCCVECERNGYIGTAVLMTK